MYLEIEIEWLGSFDSNQNITYITYIEMEIKEFKLNW